MSVRWSVQLFGKQMDEWLKQQKAVTEAVARGLAIEAFKRLLMFSPQYSGDFVMNWKISLNRPDMSPPVFTDKSLLPKVQTGLSYTESLFLAGSRKAVSVAIRMNDGRLNDFRLASKDGAVETDIIYFTNRSEHGGEHYSWKIENNEIEFRPGNEGGVVRRMLDSMAAEYGGGLTDAQVLSLRNKRMRFGNVK